MTSSHSCSPGVQASHTPKGINENSAYGPGFVKMGGITGLVRCAALAHAHGVELVSHQTQPMIGHMANMHVVAAQLQASKPIEWNDPSTRTHAVFENPPIPVDGQFHLPDEPGLGLRVNEAELAKRRVEKRVES